MNIDQIIIFSYILLINLVCLIKSDRTTLKGYLLNSGNTGFIFLLCSTAATLVGAGAVVGVSAEASRTGISFGLITAAAIVSNMLLYILIIPKVRALYDSEGIKVPSELIGARYGKLSKKSFVVFYTVVALIWTSIQLLALANMFGALIGWPISTSLILSFLITAVYTTVGGLFSDILSDFIEFWIMLLTVLIISCILFFDSNLTFGQIPSSSFDPLAFGGPNLLIGSVIIGMLYPLAHAHDWLRINSAKSTLEARKAYAYSIPFVILFVGGAAVCGLLAKSISLNTEADRAMFSLVGRLFHSGLSGVVFAGLLAVVMSTINSLLLGGVATLSSAVVRDGETEKMSIAKIRVLAILFGLAALSLSLLYPKIVSLAIIASFISMCLGPAILLALFSRALLPDKLGMSSMLVGITSLIIALPFFKMSSFLIGLLGSVVPIIIYYIKRSNSLS